MKNLNRTNSLNFNFHNSHEFLMHERDDWSREVDDYDSTIVCRDDSDYSRLVRDRFEGWEQWEIDDFHGV